jgi:hypothetical protein
MRKYLLICLGAAACAVFAATPYVAHAACSPEKMQRLEGKLAQGFARADTNRDDVITRAELTASGAKPRLLKRFDGSEPARLRGGITRDEALKVLRKRCG